MEGGHLQESNHRGPLLRRGSGTFTLWKINYDICSSILKFFIYSKQHSAHGKPQRSVNALCSHLQEVKNNGKSLNFRAQKVVAVAYRSWSFTRGSNFKALTGKILVYGRLTLTTGGHTWRFDCITIDSLLMDTLQDGHLGKKDTQSWSLPFFAPFIILTLYKTDVTLRWTLSAILQGVCLRES